MADGTGGGAAHDWWRGVAVVDYLLLLLVQDCDCDDGSVGGCTDPPFSNFEIFVFMRRENST